MQELNRTELIKEAEMQSKALKTIARWRAIAMLAASLGVLLAYLGFTASPLNLFCGIAGIVLILLGAFAAVTFNVGIHNGRRNVERILDAAKERTVI